jgi:hypothetical protein
MNELLYRYLVRHRLLPLADVGTISIQFFPGESDFVNHAFLPPHFSFRFEPTTRNSSSLVYWLSSSMNVSEAEAAALLGEYLENLKNDLNSGKDVFLGRIGHLKKVLGGEIRFLPEIVKPEFLKPAIGEKVIRENAEHTMRVGEQEMTNTEMTDRLHAEAEGKIPWPWWIWPLVMIIVLALFLGWYFSEHGLNSGSAGNSIKVRPVESHSTYQYLR